MLLAIGLSMICMVPLRRLPTWALLTIAIGWIALGELVTGWFWTPPGNFSMLATLMVANYSSRTIIIKCPLLPWLIRHRSQRVLVDLLPANASLAQTYGSSS